MGSWECFSFANTTFTVCQVLYLPQNLMDVLAVDEDDEIHLEGCQYAAPWHLQRLTQRRKLDSTWNPAYRYLDKVDKVNVYVLDTFVDCKHPQFQNNCQRVFSNQYTVQNPHGTHVAGLVSSTEFGVNKYAQIFSVEVLNDDGYGKWSKLIEGLGFVSRHANDRKQRAVINISITGTPSNVVDMVIKQLAIQGILTVVAAGNNNDNACYHSPARAPNAFTVAASNTKDQLASFSNWGECVDFIAPGDVIHSLFPNKQTGYMSGTSMAAPIVAGLASLFLSLEPELSVVELRKHLIAASTKNAVANPKQCRNMMAYQPYGPPCEYNLIFQ